MRSRLGRVTMRIVTPVVLAVAAIGVAASPASATPTGCNWNTDAWGGWAHCTGGTGQFRAVTYCQRVFPIASYFAYGTWEYPNHYSWSDCPLGTVSISTWIQYR
ncbi:hypothetical protein GCM10009682_31400 [Luedemannella flava]|uniref:Secreted protein n=1 Tax=Luedemannella flava TaxID=349316 RepID=A0ABP4YD77_9ACTN